MPMATATDSSSATARLKQLLLHVDEPPPVVVSHDRLMEVSTECLVRAQDSLDPAEQLVATRILENTRTFCLWESSHAAMMKPVSGERASGSQRAVLLERALTLIHRKALFEYLRDSRIRGRDRHRVIAHFFGNIEYTQAIVAEHGNYLRSAASYLCSSHLGSHLMLDAVFEAPLLEYEGLFQAYFKAYCDATLAGSDAPVHSGPLLSLLKHQVCDWRKALLALAHSRSGVWRRPMFVAKYRKTQ
jgi:hypothetical protein